MFPLHARSFPTTSSELSQLLNESLRRVFVVKQDPVNLGPGSFPVLERIEINLDRAELRKDAPRPSLPKGEHIPALEVGELRLDAAELSLGPATADFHLIARNVRFDQASASKEEIALILRSAKEGEIEISARNTVLESAIAALVRREAEKQGVAVEEVNLVTSTRGPRGLSAEVKVKARKLFLRAAIRIAANLDLDEQLNAVVSGLTCQGEGALGSLACGALSPHLKKIEGRSFPLMAVPLGDVRLRDIRIAAGEQITVSADFGAVNPT